MMHNQHLIGYPPSMTGGDNTSMQSLATQLGQMTIGGGGPSHQGMPGGQGAAAGLPYMHGGYHHAHHQTHHQQHYPQFIPLPYAIEQVN